MYTPRLDDGVSTGPENSVVGYYEKYCLNRRTVFFFIIIISVTLTRSCGVHKSYRRKVFSLLQFIPRAGVYEKSPRGLDARRRRQHRDSPITYVCTVPVFSFKSGSNKSKAAKKKYIYKTQATTRLKRLWLFYVKFMLS